MERQSRCALGLSAAMLLAPVGAHAQTPAAGEFQVNQYTTGNQNHPALSMDADGNYVVVWVSVTPASLADVMARRFAADGSPLGGEFRVNATTTGNQGPPVAAHLPGGSFVVAWHGPGDGSGYGIAAQRFTAAGVPMGGEFIVNSYTTSHQGYPAVSADASGFVITWWSAARDGAGWGVAGQRFDLTGARVGSEFVANSYTTGDQIKSAVASHADGSFVVVWNDGAQQDGNTILGQRFTSGGARLGGEFIVNTYTTEAQTFPAVAATPDGGFVVAWQTWEAEGAGAGYGIALRRYAPGGAPLGPEFLANVDTALNQSNAWVRAQASGDFVVVWRTASDGSASGVRGRRFDASGLPRGGEFQVNTYTTGQQWTAFDGDALAVDANGNFVVAWRSFGQDGSGYGVFTQRFGGLRPEALSVDATAVAGSNGNGVLDPGEAAAVRPSWRNENGQAQAFGGALTAFSGPAGGAHTIVDGSGDYGTVAHGTAAACTGCYTVMAAPTGARPRLHWDATLVETIVPEGHGQRKPWTLHVGGSFADVPASSLFYRFVETMLHRGVTGGCSATQYCPAASTTRAQIAVFALAAREGAGYAPPACGTPLFTDVLAENPFCPYIEELARRGAVGGCGNGQFCPNDAVTRAQMAVVVLSTLDPAQAPPPCGLPVFSDVPAGSPFCPWIEELARRGVVAGCGGGNYCPGQAVTRAQMGVFLTATFGLTLYAN